MKHWTTWLCQRLHLAHCMGQDIWGNQYYQSAPRGLKWGLGQRHGSGKPRRWVLYHGRPEASKIPATWHGWLHYMTDAPVAEDGGSAPLPNMTGTERAQYFVPLRQNETPPGIGHHERSDGYSAWAPPGR